MRRHARTVAFTERVPAWEVERLHLLLTAALGAAYALLALLAVLPSTLGFLVAACAVAGLELVLFARSPFPIWMLGRVGAGGPIRGLVRGVAALTLLVRTDVSPSWLLLAVGGLLGVHAMRAGGSALAEVSRIQRKMPVLTRGLVLASLRVPAAPPVHLGRRAVETLALPDVVLAPAAAVSVLTGTVVPLAVGVAAAAATVLAGSLVLLRSVLAMRRVPRRRFVDAVSRALDEAAPEVALYLGSGPETLYQVEMWVEVVERLGRPAVIILRDRESLVQLGPTRLPVVCVESGSVLMSLPLSSLRLALYVSHSATNLHLLRRHGITHAFIGHGDSDKSSSVSPFLKAYDEIWVSGPAAHDRFAAACLGLTVRRIVEIGRPQLDAVAATEQEPHHDPLTVLYAPTWEGYGDEAHQTSLGPTGLALLRMLVDCGVRVLYRPHPLAGTRDPAVSRAHREVMALLGDPPLPPTPEPSAIRPGTWDNLDLAGAAPSMSRTQSEAERDDWARAHIYANGSGSAHRVVPGPQVSLRVSFAAADALLADVSSVVSDFVASGKPYGVINSGGLSAPEFAARYPSTTGGYLVNSDGAGLADLLAAGGGAFDPAAEQRRELREQLLGPAEPPALELMRREVDRVAGQLRGTELSSDVRRAGTPRPRREPVRR